MNSLNDNDPVQLLVISDNDIQINQLLSSLRSKSIVVKAIKLDSSLTIKMQLNAQQGDVIVYFENNDIPINHLLQHLHTFETAIPLIFISTNNSETNSNIILQSGAYDIVAEQEKDRILSTIKRAALYYRQAKQNIELKVSLYTLEERHQALLNNTSNPFSYIFEGKHIYCNQAYAHLFAYSEIGDLSNIRLLDLVSTNDRSRLKKVLSQNTETESKILVQAKPYQGEEFDIEMIFTPIKYKDQNCLQLSVQRKIGKLTYSLDQPIEYAIELESLQTQDLLSGLDNPALFIRKINVAIRQAIKSNFYSTLLIIQLDQFIDITSLTGKSNANIVIRDISQFLQNSIQKSFTAARLSEFEFAIILYEEKLDIALELARFIKERVNQHITATSLPSLELSCLIGITSINRQTQNANEAIRIAKENLYLKINTAVNNANKREIAPNSSEMLTYLIEALSKDKFTLRYQAIVNIKNEGSACYEVLTRMLDENNYEIAPVNFIPLANANSIGEEIDRCVIRLAINTLKEQGLKSPRLIINLTHNSLISNTFLTWLKQILEQTSISSELLLFQISEIDLYKDLHAVLDFCKGLDELNLKKTICHFGCAVKPFEYLSQINPEYVKLDISIINDIFHNSLQRDNASKIIKQLHQLKLVVVVPQVEEINALPLLWEIGTDYAQGYCLQKPSQEMNYEFTEEHEITLDAYQPR